MSGYLRCLLRPTGSPETDAIMRAISDAGDAFHGTEYWSDGEYADEGDLTHAERIHAAACAASARIEELEAWQRECAPLLDYLTGSDQLCAQPVDYAREQQARLDAARKRIEADAALLQSVEDVLREASKACLLCGGSGLVTEYVESIPSHQSSCPQPLCDAWNALAARRER